MNCQRIFVTKFCGLLYRFLLHEPSSDIRKNVEQLAWPLPQVSVVTGRISTKSFDYSSVCFTICFETRSVFRFDENSRKLIEFFLFELTVGIRWNFLTRTKSNCKGFSSSLKKIPVNQLFCSWLAWCLDFSMNHTSTEEQNHHNRSTKRDAHVCCVSRRLILSQHFTSLSCCQWCLRSDVHMLPFWERFASFSVKGNLKSDRRIWAKGVLRSPPPSLRKGG